MIVAVKGGNDASRWLCGDLLSTLAAAQRTTLLKGRTVEILLWIGGGLFTWFFLGCLVCEGIDDSEQRLFKWVSSAPFGLFVPTVMAWPVLLWLWWRQGPRT